MQSSQNRRIALCTAGLPVEGVVGFRLGLGWNAGSRRTTDVVCYRGIENGMAMLNQKNGAIALKFAGDFFGMYELVIVLLLVGPRVIVDVNRIGCAFVFIL